MYSLAYVSDERVPFDTRALLELGELCSARNYASAVTGYLGWQDGRFFQYLEGEEERVRALMGAIESDERHAVVRVLELSRWRRRQFADWDMCFPESSEPAGPPGAGIRDELGRLMRTLSAPELVGREDEAPIARMIERIAALVRENDPVR